jgi:hypothetical protein
LRIFSLTFSANPNLNLRWSNRHNRPLPESVQFTLSRFENIWCADGSTLEALFRKLKSLEDVKPGSLAGKMGVVINLVTRLPVAIWFQENPRASDTRFEDNLLELISPQTLLLLDRGFDHFQFWQQLIDQGVHFITRIFINTAIEYQQVFTDGYALRDRLVKIGSGAKKTPIVTLRLIEIRKGKVWHSYLTMIYRGLYYFHGASSRGETYDPVEYFSHPDIVKCLGIVKRQRKPKQKLIIAPFPDKKRGCNQFFFQSSPKTSLTASL